MHRNNSQKIFITFFFIFLMSVLAPFTGRAQVIEDFQADININKDASVNITEEITYDFTEQPVHGIRRKIPFKYKNRRIEVITKEVLLDGHPVAKQILKEGGVFIIKIGNPNKTIAGQHHFKISYQLKNVINYFPEEDEFYWNVIYDWPVPVLKGGATVTAPSITRVKCFEGSIGSSKSCQIISQDKRRVIFSFHRLEVGEGGTIVIGLKKGSVAQPSIWQKISTWLKKYFIVWFPGLTFIWSLQRWWRHGRDPKGRGTIIPYYDVPDNISVGQASTVLHRTFYSKDISAMIIQLAVKGYLKIKQERKGLLKRKQYIFFKSDKYLKTQSKLTPEEEKLFEILFEFGEGDQVSTKDLRKEFYKRIPDISKIAVEEVIKKGYLPKDSKYNGKFMTYLAMFLFFILAVATNITEALWLYGFFISFLILFVFSFLMKHLTKKGVEMREKLLGLKMYLETAEKDRIEFHNAPEKNPERFEKLLPYAMIFKVEKKWAKQFADIYTTPPDWYEGSGTSSFNATILANEIHSFSNATNNTMVNPPSSAAEGGSGFSGGGVGGGFGGGGDTW